MQQSSAIKIVVAHHEHIFREGLRLLLDSEPGFSVVGDAPTGARALRMARDLRPDVLLVDLALPEGGINVLKKLASMPVQVRPIAMTASGDEDMLIDALEQGARGLILKESPTALLFKSIHTVLAGQVWVGRDSVGPILERMRRLSHQHDAEQHARKFRLTRRESEIVMAVAGGESNRDIARRLAVREDTVKHHVSNVFAKLGVSSRLELALFAINHELVNDLDSLPESH
jgi:two-component system, NarL family, nitrate/nitrite response regulator NarL